MALDMHQTVPGIEGMTQAIVGAGDLRQWRKYVLALMEYLAQQRITRRVGDERVLR